MMIEHEFIDRIVLLHHQRMITALVVGSKLPGSPDVALAVRRTLDELPHLVAIPLRPADVPAALHHEELDRTGGVIEMPTMQDVAVQHHVIALTHRQVAECRLQHPRPLGDIHHLIRLRVPVKVLVKTIGFRPQHRNFVVEQHRGAIECRTPALLRARRAEVPMPK